MPKYCSNCGYSFEGWDKGNCPLCSSADRIEEISKPKRTNKPYKITSGEKKGIGVGVGIVAILLLSVIIFNDTSNIPIQNVNEHLNDIEEFAKDTSKKIQAELEKKTDDISKSLEEKSSELSESLKLEPNPTLEERLNKFQDVFSTKPTIDIPELQQKIHTLINLEREKAGLDTLSFDTKLTTIARNHSEDMAKRDYFLHDTPEGKSFSDRYLKAGYHCQVPINANYYSTGAENIFYLEGYYGEDRIAQTVVNGWMDSAGHRKNILTPYFVNEGIGGAVSDSGKVYVTENFC